MSSLKSSFKKNRHVVTSANNGKEATALWNQNRLSQFDLVLMDIQMDVMNGLQATDYIRTQEKAFQSETTTQGTATPHIPIIAMTAHAISLAAWTAKSRSPSIPPNWNRSFSLSLESSGRRFPHPLRSPKIYRRQNQWDLRKIKYLRALMETPTLRASWPGCSSRHVRSI